jgi:hypothetical protein
VLDQAPESKSSSINLFLRSQEGLAGPTIDDKQICQIVMDAGTPRGGTCLDKAAFPDEQSSSSIRVRSCATLHQVRIGFLVLEICVRKVAVNF